MKEIWFCNMLLFSVLLGIGQAPTTISIDASKRQAKISKNLHGIFFEEISHGGEGGLYAEMVCNRSFEENNIPQGMKIADSFLMHEGLPPIAFTTGRPSDWKMEWPTKDKITGWHLPAKGNSITATVVQEHPLNSQNLHSLHVHVERAVANESRLVNDGFWGMNIEKDSVYDFSFFLRSAVGVKLPLKVSLESGEGLVLSEYLFDQIGSVNWKKFNCRLKATSGAKNARLVITFLKKADVWLDMVSLFPGNTFRHRPNGLRNDLANYIADLKPAFVRWPGGCFVEGINVANTPNWKKSLGPVESRPGTFSVWGYWSSDGFGYHEYLQFCEDIHAAALYVFNIGVSCEFRSGSFLPDEKVDSVIGDILDGIEYAIGPADSKWGKRRVANGHPKPFPLKFIEVGNEHSGVRYAKRYNRFYTAIKKKYPSLQIIASMGIGDVNKRTLDSMKTVDIVDEHAYKSAGWAEHHYDHFDKYQRGRWDMYVGEYATNNGVGAGNMRAALSDAVYIMAMEKNSDLVKMSSYAPLLVNVNDIDWPVNLINFNAAESFARISYYAIKMFNANRATVNIGTQVNEPPAPVDSADFEGGVGFATWDTQTEYRDLQIIEDGHISYKSDFVNRPQEWLQKRGQWLVKDSALFQPAEGAQLLALLDKHSFKTYTLTVQARKKSGFNAFIIPFALTDSNTFMRAHIGSWLNSHAVMEQVTNGYDVSDLTDQVALKAPIETDKWYTIKLEVMAHKVNCWLNDELIMSYAKGPDVFAIAGMEETSGDIIVKVVNTGKKTCATNIHIAGSPALFSQGLLTSIAAPTDQAENSFEKPFAFIPKENPINNVSSNFQMSFSPFSINVLRLKVK